MHDRSTRFAGIVVAVLLAAASARAATLTVTSTADSGAGTLRDAILTANGNGQADVIDFAPALSGQTIAPLSALPQLSASDTLIDGDLDNDCAPDINLSGASAGNVTGLSIGSGASNTVIRGLAIHGFAQAAIFVGGNNATIDCSSIGTDTGGTAALPVGAANRESITLSASNAIVGPGNLVVNGRGAGIRVSDGQAPAYPDFVGLTSDAPPRVYPTIDFSESCGSFTGSGFTPLDASGHPFTENFGLRLRGRLTVSVSGTYAFNFLGVDDNARLRIDGGVIGDVVGSSPPLSASLVAGAHTIEIDFRENFGAARLQPTLSGPGSMTLTTDDQATCATGQPGLCAELFQLRIAHAGNRITRNRMHDNAGLGIALGSCGPYANDAGDADVGPNTLLNVPLIASLASLGGGDFNVTGTAPAGSTVEVFQAANDPSGAGEGATFLGQTTATAGGNFSLVVQPALSGALTATATAATGDTSEFAKNFVYSTGASALLAIPRSSGSIELDWRDPNLGETGFRIERSTDGATFGVVTSVGGNTTTFADSGLSAATLYYYRVIAVGPGGDAPSSNRATASTFPSSAAKTCFERIDRNVAFALAPAVDFDGSAWAMAWSERNTGSDNIDLVFRRFDSNTLAPIAPARPVSTADMNVSSAPLLAWNGSHHGVVWYESVRGPAGSDIEAPLFFALLDVDGNVVKGNVRVPAPVPPLANQLLIWDGAHWGLIGVSSDSDLTTTAYTDVYLLRLNEDGTATGAPVLLTSTAQVSEGPVGAAWNAAQGQYGVAFVRGNDTAYQVLFQRFGPAGAPIDATPVVLDSFTPPSGEFGFGNVAVVWDGVDWAVTWSRDDPTSLVESPVYLRRVDGTTGLAQGAAPTRLSDDGADDSSVIALLPRPGGGYAAFVNTLGTVPTAGLGLQTEIARMQADASGARVGAKTYVTPNDGVQSTRASVASDGSRFLLAYALGASGTLPNEINGVLLAADGSGGVPAPVALTTGHDAAGSDLARTILLAPLGAGFVGAWADGPFNAQRINVRIWNGAGQIVSTLSPLTATSLRSGLTLTSVGNTFALAWKSSANNGDLVFARYNATGGSITGEKTVATATSGGNVALGWSGESYALFYQIQGGARFLRVDDNGNAIGAPIATVRQPDTSGALAWLGDGWGLLTRAALPSGQLDYAHFAPDGTLLEGPTTVVTPLFGPRGARSEQLAFTGHDLAASWTDWRGLDPPSEDVYFTALATDGTPQYAPIAAISTGLSDNGARLYAAGDDFRLIANGFGNQAGMREIGLTPAGAPTGVPRFVSNRSSAIGTVATAYNGATLGALYFASNLQHLYFHTDACLADASPPSCPVLSTGFANGAVQLSWTAASDPESGVVRYLVYRDGLPLAENDADALAFTDGGFGAASSYEVRAMNGAFVESVGCAAQVPDVDSVFKDGFE